MTRPPGKKKPVWGARKAWRSWQREQHVQRRPGCWKEIRKSTEWPGPCERGGLAQNMASDQGGPQRWAVTENAEFILDIIRSQWSP